MSICMLWLAAAASNDLQWLHPYPFPTALGLHRAALQARCTYDLLLRHTALMIRACCCCSSACYLLHVRSSSACCLLHVSRLLHHALLHRQVAAHLLLHLLLRL